MMKLIPNWRRAWRMFSVQLATIIVVWSSLPSDTQAAMVEAVGIDPGRVPLILGVLIILARVIDQPRAK